MDPTAKSKNRNKTVRCAICSKDMSSAHLNRHMRSHKDILSLTEDEVRDELRARHGNEKLREERRQRIKEIADEENIPINLCNDVIVNDSSQTLRENLLQGNQAYLKKVDLGRDIAVIIDEGDVREESLTKAHKEALDLYRKQMPRIDIEAI